ncbi:MAG TPA: chemotaxis response regulator protein-glutamate methylesterase [Gemmatimonas aurantiaca]|uniref:Protein-glutamate methylesterase/protein-glutamine glutaminase n=2 Tax=Gemmatimonas aurantiaca TaxID=173480 RepID=C1A821_GEMAT|nr:chemotaxis-specific protein-glutamate methyltransferase CheB [Gemmatimonas aurantiaca]BAH38381.1 chemotaxis response regulator protein-glutamate methylesterase [Gemmatimonas aurantiaca T-27]HCT56287.1 chemotaxis response regulator protein-glutamate methylesterase [Gemmatimonas aurantiaca]
MSMPMSVPTPVRVLIAEDSATLRDLLRSILETDPDIVVVGEARTGAEAVHLAVELEPDLIMMDVHMPVMDGLEATREIMTRRPTPIIIVSSSSSGDDVSLPLQAVLGGALMLVRKPDDPTSSDFDTRQSHLLTMVKALSQVKVVRRAAGFARASGVHRVIPGQADAATTARVALHRGPVRVVTIAASTGGPAAIARVLRALPADYPVPILIVQHIALGFGVGFVDWLATICPLAVRIARHGERPVGGTVYVAPDDSQFGLQVDGTIHIDASPAVGGFRPSATVLFESAARAHGAAVVSVILTGMGSDGVDGLRAVRAARGLVIAQDEASSVVYGMPREAVAAGTVDHVLPLDEIASMLMTLKGPRLQ